MTSPASTPEPAAQPHLVQESTATAPQVPVREEAAQEVEVEKEGEGEGEEGECGFCLFMKGGGCKDAFVAWEECVEAAEKEGSDMVERCFQATANLKKCMDAHADYYAPVLQAEQAVSDHAEAAIAADADKNKEDKSVPSPATDGKEEVVEKAVSSPAAEETKKEEAVVVEKVESLSLSN